MGHAFSSFRTNTPSLPAASIWTSDPQEPEGLFFLTDSRVVFEQRQEVAKRKFCSSPPRRSLSRISYGRLPSAASTIEIEDQKAFLQRKEMMTLRFHERTREMPSDITLQLRGTTNEAWRTLASQRPRAGTSRATALVHRHRPRNKLAAQVEAEDYGTGEGSAHGLPQLQCSVCRQIFKGMKQVRSATTAMPPSICRS
jgi:hypothetical protein